MQPIQTIRLHGREYVEVRERLRMVHESGRKLEVVESVPHQVGDRCLWRVVVLIDGTQYVGNAEVKLSAKSGPDHTNPFECSETSALGRALAFAGFGSVESIASFDEVARAITERESLATGEQVARIRRAYELLGKGEFDAAGLTASAANELIEQLTFEYRQVKKAS
jgi:hypothetical protein